MPQRGKTRIFPLHLAPIDEFFCLDDRPKYPMAFTCHLFFNGEVRRDAFDFALIKALARHPLLRAVIRPAKANKPCWVSAGDQLPWVHWGAIGDPFEFETTEAFDLTREVGLRIWVRTGIAGDRSAGDCGAPSVSDDETLGQLTVARSFSDCQSEILLQFHHACTDGNGAYRFIGDLLAEYGIRTATNPADSPVIELCDERLLKDRRGKMAGQAAYGTRSGVIKRGLGHAGQVFSRRIAPLSVPERDNVDPDYRNDFHWDPYPGIVSHVFDRSEYQALRGAASHSGAMFNDLLLSEMFMTLRIWNRRHGAGSRQRLRIMMPTDLREKKDILMPAANMTAYSFITRASGQCDDHQALLRSVRDETLRIKHDQSGKRFIDAVMASSHIPGLTSFLLNRQRCLATVILSNVGDPSRRFLARFPREQGKVRCGNLRLEHVSGTPPLRPLSRATVSIVTYGREFAVHVRCDPYELTRDDAREFLDLYVSRLASHLPHREPAPAEPGVVAAV